MRSRIVFGRALGVRRRLTSVIGGEALLPHPVRLGVGLLGALVAALLAAQWLLGREPFARSGLPGDVLVALLHCVLLAYLVAAYFAVLRQGTRAAAALRSQVESARSTPAVVPLPPLAPPTPGWGVAALLGVAFAFIGPYLTEPHVAGPLEFWHVQAWLPEVYWHRLLGLAIGVWFGWFAFAVVQVSQQLSRLAQALKRIDIFDLQPLRPFAQQGLTNGLLAAGLLSLASLFALDEGLTWMLLTIGTSAMAVVALAILLPVRGVHRRIRKAKLAELAWCDAAIQRERSALRGGTRHQGRLADLIAYRGLVQQVREWPFDTPTVRRMALYLLIPLGSWVASAVVQYLVERFVLGS